MNSKSKKSIFTSMNENSLSKLFEVGNIFGSSTNIFDFNLKTNTCVRPYERSPDALKAEIKKRAKEKLKSEYADRSVVKQPDIKKKIKEDEEQTLTKRRALTEKINREVNDATRMLVNMFYSDPRMITVLTAEGLAGKYVNPVTGMSGRQTFTKLVFERIYGIAKNRNIAQPSYVTGAFVKPQDIERAKYAIIREMSERADQSIAGDIRIKSQTGRFGLMQKKERKLSDKPIDYKSVYGEGRAEAKGELVEAIRKRMNVYTPGLVSRKSRITTYDKLKEYHCKHCGAPMKIQAYKDEFGNVRIKMLEEHCPNCGSHYLS